MGPIDLGERVKEIGADENDLRGTRVPLGAGVFEGKQRRRRIWGHGRTKTRSNAINEVEQRRGQYRR